MDNKELFHAVDQTHYVSNPHAREKKSDGIHPDYQPEHFAIPESGMAAIDLFIERISALSESDYGDFMREANLYICDLKETFDVAHVRYPEVIERIQNYTQFFADWRIEPTRDRILRDARALRAELARG